MSKNRIVFVIGSILFLIPFLGFPSSWKTFFSIVSGLILISLSLSNSIKRRMTIRNLQSKSEVASPVFVDSKKTEKESDSQ
jgi:hypothetical protein